MASPAAHQGLIGAFELQLGDRGKGGDSGEGGRFEVKVQEGGAASSPPGSG